MGTTETRRLPEAALFAPLKAWFEERGYEVFAEVPCFSTAIDLVAIKDGFVTAVELKVSLTKRVIHQARLNDMCADKTYAAVGTDPRDVGRCADAGIGLFTVRDGVVSLAFQPSSRHAPQDYYKQQIIDKCKSGVFNGVGGMPCLEGVGVAQDCKRRVDAYREAHPKTTWREIFANVPNHYASHNSMRQSLTAGLEKYARIKELRKVRRERERGPNVAKKSAKKKTAKKKTKAKKKAKVAKKAPAAEKVAPKVAPKTDVVVIRDRIKEFRRVRASELAPDPDNWRTHPRAQKVAVAGILEEIGYADALLARETPEGLMLIDGHLRRELTPDQEIPVLVLDLTEAEARTMLALLDPLAAMAGTDKVKLGGLLAEIKVDSAALDDMLDKMAVKAGLPVEDGAEGEGLDDDQTGQYNVLVVCDDEAQQLKLIERFMEEGLTCRGLIS